MAAFRLHGIAAVVAAGLLVGCAWEPTRVPLGTPEAEVIQRLGPPTGRYAMPDGTTRLQYSRQPMGPAVSNVDLDAQGRVRVITQVLEDARFHQDIRSNEWTREDLLRHYGQPAFRSQVSSFKGDVWTWRYHWYNTPRLLHVFVDTQGVVRRYETADEQFLEPDL